MNKAILYFQNQTTLIIISMDILIILDSIIYIIKAFNNKFLYKVILFYNRNDIIILPKDTEIFYKTI